MNQNTLKKFNQNTAVIYSRFNVLIKIWKKRKKIRYFGHFYSKKNNIFSSQNMTNLIVDGRTQNVIPQENCFIL